MTYKELIETLEIVAKYDGGLDSDCLKMWAEHDEHGISFDYKWDWDPKDVRRLAEIGWGLGSDDEFDEDTPNISPEILRYVSANNGFDWYTPRMFGNISPDANVLFRPG